MVVCSFFQHGSCRYGNNCKYEHPRDGTQTTSMTFGNKTWTSDNKPVYLFTTESIGKDLSLNADKPNWPLSSYAPSKYEPNIIPNLDESPEELRVKASLAMKTGAINEYVKYESERIAHTNQIYNDASNHLQQVFEQASKQSTAMSAAKSQPSSAFGSSSAAAMPSLGGETSSVFGKPSAFGATSSTPRISAFGTPSFPSSTGTNTVFGSTSVFGKPAFGQPAFGQTSTPAGQSAFAQPTSAFGQTQPTSVFEQTSKPQSSFIKPASGAFGSSLTFGQSSFGAPTSNQSAFSSNASGSSGGFSAFAGQPTAFGATASSDRPIFGQTSFGTSANPPPPFSAATSSAVPFGNPPSYQDATSSPSVPPSAFSTLTQQRSNITNSAFGGSAFTLNPTSSSSDSAFGSTSTAPTSAFSAPPSMFTSQQQQQNQPRSVFASTSTVEAPRTTSVFGSLLSQPSSSPFTSSSSRSQNGPPDFSAKKAMWDKLDSLLPENYLQILPTTVLEAFQGQKFVWGQIPEWIPPKELR